MAKKKNFILLLLILSAFCTSLASATTYNGFVNTTSNTSISNLAYPLNNTLGIFGNTIWGFSSATNPSSSNTSINLVCSSPTSCSFTANGTSSYLESESGNVANVTPTNIWSKYTAVYHFNANGLDSSGNSNNAIISPSSTFGSGMVGNAVTLNGKNGGNITLPNLFQPTNLSIEMWIMKRGDAFDGGLNMSSILVDGGAGGTHNIILQIPSQFADKFRWRVSFGLDARNCDSLTTPAKNVWYHLVATINSTGGTPTTALYVNGVKECEVFYTGSENTPVDDLGANWLIGYDDGNQIYLNATIDELRVTPVVLKQNEVIARYETQKYAYSSLNPLSPPSITGITINPNVAFENSTLNCSAVYNDNSGLLGNITINWYNGSSLYQISTLLNVNPSSSISSILASGIMTSGNIFNCTMSATDGNGLTSNLVSTTKTISNTIPDVAEMQLVPISPSRLDSLNCSAIITHQDSNQVTNANFTFYVNGILNETISFLNITPNTEQSVTLSPQSLGANVTCDIIAYDPFNSSNIYELSRIVGNRIPQISDIALNTPLDQLTAPNCTAFATDSDDSVISVNFTFLVNDATFMSSLVSGNRNTTFSFSIPAQNTGDNVTCLAYATDGFNSSNTILTSTIIGFTTPPAPPVRNIKDCNGNAICETFTGIAIGFGNFLLSIIPSVVYIIIYVVIIAGIILLIFEIAKIFSKRYS